MAADRQGAHADTSVGALIERVAAQRPDATFLIEPETGQAMSFAELRGQVAAMSLRLRRLGLARGDRVGVAMDNGAAAIVSTLAAMSGGFVAVPLDPDAGPTHLAHVLEHCAARVILVGDERRAQIATIAAERRTRIESVDLTASAGARRDGGTGPQPAAGPDDDVLLMYTSGTTGRPKGVLVSQAGIVARTLNHATAHEIDCDDRLLCVLPLFHMSALIIMLGVLHSGGSMVVPPRFSVARYWDWAVAHRCTWLGVVPTIVTQLLRWGEAHAGPPPAALRRVRFARCSSAPLRDDAHRAFEDRFGIVLVQGMGMTEAGGIFLNPPHRTGRKIGALGRTCGLEVKVVGPAGDTLGCGQTGELMVRGPAVMRGYYRDAPATAGAIDAAGWLRTGDLVYRDDDGFFFHASRAKDLIIKAGTNVAPREIDEALASHPDVAQAAAVGVPDPDLGEDIGAFAVLRDGARCTEQVLLEHCAARLGEFKTPSWITFVDALPAGPTGKIQRAQLAERFGAAQCGAGDAVPGQVAEALSDPADERAIAATWADILGCAPPGRQDDFFALGGTSLHALRLTSRLRHALGVQLSLGSVLAAPTVAAQAALLAAKRRRAASDAASSDEPAAEAGATPATLLSPAAADGTVPLFCVHEVARFRRLAELLGPRHPVYGVTVGPAVAAIAGGQPVSAFSTYSIEELARACVAEIRRVQPLGPYQVAGFSFGGRIALEVAQQLRAAGATVRLLVIVDTFMPGTFRQRRFGRIILHLSELRRRGPRYVAAAARRRWAAAPAVPPPIDAADTAALEQRSAAFRQELRARYRPQPFPGDVVLFRATQRDLPSHYRMEPLLGWDRIARGTLSVHDVPGAHLEILDDHHVAMVAAALRSYLKT